ncbi:hypothetical protein [Roseateles sp.]
MPELRDVLFALCVAVAAGCTYVLYMYARDFLIWHLGRLVAVLREALR